MKKFLLQQRYNFCHILLGCAITVILSLIVQIPINLVGIWIITVLVTIALTVWGLLSMP
ncbi:MAG: hypothetical protein RIT04_584 [Candidatus Parcubacteria bacterium]|jgi:hypothetical protein